MSECPKVSGQGSGIDSLQQGGGVGCPGCIAALNPWSKRYQEFVSAVLPNECTLLVDEEEWKRCGLAGVCST